MALKILVIDDHALVREGLRQALKQIEHDALILEARDGAGALREADAYPDLDLVLLDLGLPGSDGFTVLTNLRRNHPAIPVVIVSASDEYDNISRAIEHGAMGFIPKSAPGELMLGALRLVLAGGMYVPPQALARTVKSPPIVRTPRRHAKTGGLTSRQQEVLKLMAGGESNKSISKLLTLSEATVKSHVSHILKALKVSNRTQAVRMLRAEQKKP
ncbi:MAG: response regulator transcription factor [Pseudomonadota bacterium]